MMILVKYFNIFPNHRFIFGSNNDDDNDDDDEEEEDNYFHIVTKFLAVRFSNGMMIDLYALKLFGTKTAAILNHFNCDQIGYKNKPVLIEFVSV